MTTPEDFSRRLESDDVSSWTSSDLKQLRAELAESSNLHEALRERLVWEEVLFGGLARPIIDAADIRMPKRGSRRGTVALAAFCVLLVVAAGVTRLIREHSRADDRSIAADGVDQPSNDTTKPNNSGKTPPDVPAKETPAIPQKQPPETVPNEDTTTDKPWLAAQPDGGAAVPWRQLAWQPIAINAHNSGEALHQWFVPWRAGSGNFGVGAHLTRMSGEMRLQASWPADAALRLQSTFDKPVTLHVIAKDRSVMLTYDSETAPYAAWSAYVSSQVDSGNSLPTAKRLAAADHGKFWRWKSKQLATVTLRQVEDHLELSIGNATLLRIPFAAGSPQFVVAGELDVNSLEIVPVEASAGLPSRLQAARSIMPREWRDATGRVVGEAPYESEIKLDGKASTKIWAPFHPPAWSRWFVELAQLGPGAEFFLGDEQGQPLFRFRIERDRASGRNWIRFVSPESSSNIEPAALLGLPIPWCAQRCYLRPRAAGPFVWGEVSVDGRNWAPICKPREIARGYRVQSIGLSSVATASPAQLSIRSIATPASVGSFVNVPAFPTQDFTFQDVKTYDQWVRIVDASCPKEIERDRWRIAAARQFTTARYEPELSAEIMERLFAAEFENVNDLVSTESIERQLDRLDDWVFHWGPWHEEKSNVTWSLIGRAYSRLAERIIQLGTPNSFSLVGRRMLASPAWFEEQQDFWLTPAATWQLTALVERADWQGVRDLNQVLRLRDDRRMKQDTDWATTLANEADPVGPLNGVEAIPPDWYPPLEIEVNRSDFERLARLRAMIRAKQYDDACRQIAGGAVFSGSGMAPADAAGRLWISVPLEIEQLFQRHPELSATMKASFTSLAKVRLRKALETDDVRQMQELSEQFRGTSAADEARRWLGDYYLAQGDFLAAIKNYQSALAGLGGPAAESPVPLSKAATDLQARIRFSAAMLGTSVGTPTTTSVDFGGEQLSAHEFEKLVAQMLARADSARASQSNDRPRFAPADLAVSEFGPADKFIKKRSTPPPIDYLKSAVAVASRELALTGHPGALFVSNRFGIAAFDPRGQQRWEVGLGKLSGRENAWPMVRMTPRLADRLVVARLITQQGPQMYALEAATGKILWQAMVAAGEIIVCDPLIVGDHVLVLVGPNQGRRQSISLARFDLASGDRIHITPVMMLGDRWRTYGQATLAYRDQAVFAVLGGTVAKIQYDGKVQWIRRQTWRAPELVRHWYRQRAPNVGFHKNSLIVSQPGVDFIAAIDGETGAEIWRYEDPLLLGIVGVADDLVVAQREDGFFVLNATKGKQIHALVTATRGDGVYLDGASNLLFFRPGPEPEQAIQAWWWDIKRGELVGGVPLRFASKQPEKEKVVAPLAAAGGRLFAGAASFGETRPAELISLFRQAKPPPIEPPVAHDPWTAPPKASGD